MSGLDDLRATWDELGREDPLWAVLSTPETRGNRWRSDEFFATGRAEVLQLMGRIRTLGIDLPTTRCLDFGCGVGRLSQALAEHFDRVDGVDIAPSMIARAREGNRHGDRCTYHVNGARDLRVFADGTFDLIYTRLVLMHMRPRHSKAYIGEFIRVLTPTGLAVFHVPSSRPVGRQVLYSLAMGRRALLRAVRRVVRRQPSTLPPDYRHVMYPVPKRAVLRVLRRSGATLIAMDESEAADHLHDVMYYAVRHPHGLPS